jgi:hypothetical protein
VRHLALLFHLPRLSFQFNHTEPRIFADNDMDIASSAANVVGLVFNFAKAAKTCKAVRGRYKDAAFTIDSIRHQSETLH